MAQEKIIRKEGLTITRRLAADVTIVADGGLAVVATANEGEIKVCDSQNAIIEGILMQNGKAGDLVPIFVDGILPVQVTAAVNRSVYLITSSNGKLFPCPMTSGTTYNIAAKSYTKATAADMFVSVMPVMSPLRIKA